MMNNQNVEHAKDCKCLAWGPIFAGTLVAIGLTFLLSLFGTAIGLTAYTTTSDGVETLALGGLIGICIGVVASMFGAGWLTGYICQRHCNKRHLGTLYGFLVWCLAIFIILLSSHQMMVFSFYGHAADMAQMAVASSGGTGAANSVVISTYVTFVLYFLSAIACGLGGHCGMRHVCKEC